MSSGWALKTLTRHIRTYVQTSWNMSHVYIRSVALRYRDPPLVEVGGYGKHSPCCVLGELLMSDNSNVKCCPAPGLRRTQGLLSRG